MSDDFDKYLAIANHDIQRADDYGQLRFYVASILYDYDKKAELLQQKENIIKEVREYITKQVHRNQQFYEMDIENILGILDKDITKKSDCNYEKVEKENK